MQNILINTYVDQGHHSFLRYLFVRVNDYDYWVL